MGQLRGPWSLPRRVATRRVYVAFDAPALTEANVGVATDVARESASAHPCGRSSPSLPMTPPSHVVSPAEEYRILLASAPHAAIATMAPPQVRSASPQNQATQRKPPEIRVGPKWGRGIGFCASARVGPAAVAMRSERPVHSAEQPAHPKRHYRHSIGLGLDSPAKPLVKSDSGVASGVCCLAVQVLGGPRRLIELSLNLGSGVSC